MFTQPATADLAYRPRKGLCARVAGGFSRLGAALRHAVAGGLHRPQEAPDSRTAPEANEPSAANTPAPRRTRQAHAGVLARLTGGRRTPTAAQRRSRELADAAFIDASFPGLHPDLRAFFHTPVGECDPEMLRVVLEALAQVIAGTMTPQAGMRDAQDVFLALSTRLGATLGDAGPTPPAAVPEQAAAPADAAATAALDRPAGAPALPGAASPGDPPAPPSDGMPDASGAAAAATPEPDPLSASTAESDPPSAATAESDPPAAAQAAPRPPTASAGASRPPNAPERNRFRAPSRHARRGSLRIAPGGAGRRPRLRHQNVILLRRRNQLAHQPRPPRLLCYAACAGPPAPFRRAASGAPYRKACTGPSHGGPAIADSGRAKH